jgi:nicotinic acid mononucleotide adenylyltransferase
MTRRHSPPRPAVLAFSGSFNPIHTQHVRALEIAKACAVAEGWTVRAAFLSPSDDAYVNSKGLESTFSLAFRIRLCELAVAEYPWISVWKSGESGSFRVAREIVESLSRPNDVKFTGPAPKAIVVMGSDAAERILRRVVQEWCLHGRSEPWHVERIICCILRSNEDPDTWLPALQEELPEQLTRIGIRVSVADPARLGLDLRDVSSTLVRRLMAQRDWTRLAANHYLHQRVLEALREATQAVHDT